MIIKIQREYYDFENMKTWYTEDIKSDLVFIDGIIYFHTGINYPEFIKEPPEVQWAYDKFLREKILEDTSDSPKENP